MRRLNIKIYLVVLFFLFSFQVIQAKENNKTVKLIYQTEEERAWLQPLIEACGTSVIPIQTAAYNITKGTEYIVLTDSKWFEAMEAEGKRLFCIGNGFEEIDQIQSKQIKNKAIEISGNGAKQVDLFVSEISVITAYEGTAYGEVTLRFGEVYPFGVSQDQITYVPYVDKENLSVLLLSNMIKTYLGDSQWGNVYLLIDKIYPFVNFNQLQQLAEAFYQKGITWIARIMPVYENSEYPAFKRYAQVLRFVQSKGGSIVLHAPLEDKGQPIQESLEQRIEKAKQAYSKEKIVLNKFEREPYQITMEKLQAFEIESKIAPKWGADLAITYQMPKNQAEIQRIVETIDEVWFSLERLGEGNFRFEEEQIEEMDYEYTERYSINFETFFNLGSRVLTYIVGIGVSVFIGVLIISKKNYKKKFYKKE